MRTTIDLPDDLFRRVKARAALDGVKLKDLITRYIELGLGASPPAAPRERSVLPVARPAGGARIASRTNSELFQLLDES